MCCFKCCLKFEVLLLVIRVVLGFILANMRALVCLIRKRSCSGWREAHAFIERNWTTGTALLHMCTACKLSFNFYKGCKYKRFMLQNQYKRSLTVQSTSSLSFPLLLRHYTMTFKAQIFLST